MSEIKTKEQILEAYIYKKVEAFGEAVTPEGAIEAMEAYHNQFASCGQWSGKEDVELIELAEKALPEYCYDGFAHKHWIEGYKAAQSTPCQCSKYREVLEAILKDPYGCRFCDSGKLRKPNDPKKDHDYDCGYLLALEALNPNNEK